MLAGDLVTLRPIQFEDWQKTQNWRNDLFIKSSTMSHPFPITAEQEQGWYRAKLEDKSSDYIPFSVVGRQSGELIGYMSLSAIHWINRNCIMSGVIGDRQNIGHGFGMEAARLLRDYAFNMLGMEKIYLYMYADHPAQKSVLKDGAVVEGRLSRHSFRDGRLRDVTILAFLRPGE